MESMEPVKKKIKLPAILALVLLLASLAANMVLFIQNLRLAEKVEFLSFEADPAKIYIYTVGDAVVCDYLTTFKSEKDFESCEVRVVSEKIDALLEKTELACLPVGDGLCARVWLHPKKAEDTEALYKLATSMNNGYVEVIFNELKTPKGISISYTNADPETQRPEWGA